MKYSIMIFFSLILLFGISFANEKQPITEEKDRISYSLGYQIGGDFKQQNLDFDADSFLMGIKDAMTEVQPQLTDEEMHTILLEMKKKIMTQQKTKQVDRRLELQDMKEKYWGEGREFLTENAKKEGVITLPSGLQYKVIKEGTGRMPGSKDTIIVHYRGTLIDGTEFDSSHRENKPGKFRVDGVIAGWREALQLMKEGSKWQIFVPADLAYGERGPLADRTVIFDLELISVESSE